MTNKVVNCLTILGCMFVIIGCSNNKPVKIDPKEVRTADVSIRRIAFYPDINKEEIRKVVELYNNSTFITNDVKKPISGIQELKDDSLSGSNIAIEIDTKTHIRITYIEDGNFKVYYNNKGGHRSYIIKQVKLKDYLEEKRNRK